MQMDLVDDSQAAAVEVQLRSINSTAHIIRTTRSRVPLAELLSRGAYRLRLLDNTPQQQQHPPSQQQQRQPGLPTAAATVPPTTAAQPASHPGPRQQLPAVQEPLAWLGDRIAQAASTCTAAGCEAIGSDSTSGPSSTQCSNPGCSNPEHHHHHDPAVAPGSCQAHDAAVRTIALRSTWPVDMGRFRAWVEHLLWEQQQQPGAAGPATPATGAAAAVQAADSTAPAAATGASAPVAAGAASSAATASAAAAVAAVPQLLRMKGLLDVAGSDCVHLFQAVYDLYDVAPGASWQQFLQQQQQQGAGRLSRLVLIGRGLDQAALQAAFEQCCEPS